MQHKRIVAVVGATGAQGGGLARAILNDPEGGFAVRALTRKPSSPKAQELAQLGAEVVQADLDDPASLRRAFDGAYGAFCVTNFWEHFSPQRETAQAANMAAAAKSVGLHHVIWSTLEDTRRWIPLEDNRMPTLMGKYKVPHFDAKGEADRFFLEAGLPVTLLLTSFYFENFIYFGMGPRRTPNGKLVIAFPMGSEKLPGIAVEDIGKCAYGIFRSGAEFKGKTVGVAAEHLSGAEMAAALSRALGTEVVYEALEPEAYRNLGFPGAQDLGNMFQFNWEFAEDFCKARSIELSRRLNPSLQTFDAWLELNKSRIPIA
ncbi:MAG: NmrA/HSCARG family protein [Bryobacteraceae bacterium]|nr:NmrA/HSCARG family protein [Bryobacteraceae bacterium]